MATAITRGMGLARSVQRTLRVSAQLVRLMVVHGECNNENNMTHAAVSKAVDTEFDIPDS